jgi:two-component system, response regulator PdtaR
MPTVNVLIVEDELFVAESIRLTLLKLGYNTTSIVLSGEDAIKKADEERPDVVLMDIGLKGDIDGIEAADEIYSRFQIPVIYLTAYSDLKTRERAKQTKNFGYLLKPFTKELLDSAILKSLDSNREKEPSE